MLRWKKWFNIFRYGRKNKVRRRTILTSRPVLESLEERVLPAGNLPWPVPAINGIHPLYSSFGQFVDDPALIYMHEGIDILAPAGTAVTATEGGTIIGVFNGGGNPFR